MTEPAPPNPSHLPTLTEVIELVPPTPVGDGGMHRSACPLPPAPGTPGSIPIVTGGLPSSQAPASWTPMTTVVVPTLSEEVLRLPAGVPWVNLPVLDTVVPELSGFSAVPPAEALAPPVAREAAPEPEPGPVHEAEPALPAETQAAAHHLLQPAPESRAEPAFESAAEPAPAPELAALPAEPGLPAVSDAQVAQRVLGVVQRQIDGMIDFRLREAMAPILARHTEALVRDLREELGKTMGDVVARAVAQEMSKLRQR